jgi:hypothetical protein
VNEREREEELTEQWAKALCNDGRMQAKICPLAPPKFGPLNLLLTIFVIGHMIAVDVPADGNNCEHPCSVYCVR